MQLAWEEVKRLIRVNARHRSGILMGNVDPDIIINHAFDELRELVLARDDPQELADLFGVLIHYAIRQGWTESQLEQLMLEKFKERFTEPPAEVR
jgi:hypothetical protein